MGLLGLTLEELESTALGDFVLRAESSLLMEDEKVEQLADRILPYHAVFTSFLIQSSGNMKKQFDPLKTAEGLYPSNTVWGDSTSGTGPGKEKMDYAESKEKLLSTFELKE